MLQHPLVDALVPAAREGQPRLHGQLVRHRLGEPLPGRARHQQVRCGVRVAERLAAGPLDRVECLTPRLRSHHHAGPSAVGRVVDRPVPVVGEVAQIVYRDVEQSLLAGLADQGESQRVQVAREDRDDVDPHQASSGPNMPPGGSTTTRPPGTSTTGTSADTNGTRTCSPPPAGRTTSRSCAPPVSSCTSSPRTCPSGSSTRSPTSSSSYQASSSSEASAWTTSIVSRSASAAARSAACSNASRSTPRWSRALTRVSGPRSAGSVSNTAPGTNRCSGTSVRTSMLTSPRRPWARPMRATTRSMAPSCPADRPCGTALALSRHPETARKNGPGTGAAKRRRGRRAASPTSPPMSPVLSRSGAGALSESGRCRRCRPAPTGRSRAPRRPCGERSPCDPSARSPGRGRPGARGPRASRRGDRSAGAPRPRPGAPRCLGPGARAPPRARSGLRLRGVLGGLGRLGGHRGGLGARRLVGRVVLDDVLAGLGRSLATRGGGGVLRLLQRLARDRVEDLIAVGLGRGDAQRPLGARQALVLLPVAGDLEQYEYLVARLGADAQPVLRPLGVDLDERRLAHRVVLADLLDRAAIALGARVGDDDAVVRGPDLAQALETDLDGHGCGHS